MTIKDFICETICQILEENPNTTQVEFDIPIKSNGLEIVPSHETSAHDHRIKFSVIIGGEDKKYGVVINEQKLK